MKITVLNGFVAIALSFAAAGQMPGQMPAQILDQNGPLGRIGWSSSAPLCQPLANTVVGAISYGDPSSVTFGPRQYGSIGMICNMPGIMNGLTMMDIKAFAFTFSNPNGFYGCTAWAQVVDRTTATPVAKWSTDSDPYTSYAGIWTVNLQGLNLVETHTYDVEFYLSRIVYAEGLCNLVAYAGYLETSF